jgi:hypothetical protein
MRSIPFGSIVHFCLAASLVLPLGCVRAQFSEIGDAGGGGAGGANPDVLTVTPAPVCSLTSLSGCSPMVDTPCDPVCQTGDCSDCQRAKCGMDNAGNPACVPLAETNLRSAQETCDPPVSGSSYQTDNCVAGAICLTSGGASSTANNCFDLCRGPGDTTSCSTACTPRPLWTGEANKQVYVCDPPYKTCGSASNTCCNPYNPTDNNCQAGSVCYLLPSKDGNNSQTVCEYAAGTSRDSCTNSRDCLPKNVCAPPGRCKRVCDAQNLCTAPGETCIFLGQYGYCSS